MSKILIKDTHLLTMVEQTLEDPQIGDILIEDNKITKIGKFSCTDDVEIIDGKNTVALPGLVNCHGHAAMTLLRGYADDMELMQWLEEKIWPREAKMTEEHIYWGTMLACLEMIKSGTTTFADMYISMNEVANAVTDSGMRACLSRGITGGNGQGEDSLIESKEFIQKWKGKERITCMMGPHAPYTCTDDYMKKIINLAKELQVGIHIHLAETEKEFLDIQKQRGKTPVAHMKDLGLFELPVLAAHCVHITSEDINILKEANVAVAHNPESNLKLASGIAPVVELLEKEVTVGLGTDGASSNNNLNMFEEFHLASLLHKATSKNPTVIPAYQALQMGTIYGAKALGLDQEIGSLEVGKRADIILLDLHKAHLYPCHDIVANLVYSAQAADVKTSIIDGKLIMQDRKILAFDEEKVITEAKRVAEELMRD